jgi:kumamolisin
MQHRALALLAATASAILMTAPARAATTPPIEVARVPHAAGLADLGRAPAAMPVHLAFTLNYRHGAELDALIERFADPSSPLFGRRLSPEQFRAYFSAAADDYEHAIRLLGRSGLTVTQTYANRTVIDAVAPSATVERLFGTEIRRVAQAGEGVRYANARPATMPSAMRPFVSGVTGFNDLRLLHTHHVFGQRRTSPFDARVGLPLRGPDGGYGPLAFAQGYNLPVQHGFDGTGHTAGIVIGGDPSDSDLATFLSTFHVKRTGKTTRVPIDGGPGHDLGDLVEATLDYEQTVSLAPGANIIIYEPNQIPFNQIIDSYNRAVSDAKVEALNSSFGICESLEPAFAQQTDQIAKQALAIGIVFHASTGDAGSNGDQCGGTNVDAPASSPNFVAVGGTSLSVDTHGNYFAETGWFAAGGGVSVLFALPSYQKGVKNVITSGRNLPDLAYAADPSQGASFFFGGVFQGPIGGTSLSSPIFGAVVVEVNQMHKSKVGWNAAAYAAFKAKGYGKGKAAFWHDVTIGSNGAFNAMKGYDQVTGIGSTDTQNLSTLIP